MTPRQFKSVINELTGEVVFGYFLGLILGGLAFLLAYLMRGGS